LISKAISDAYNRFIPHSSFPAYIINLEIDPTLVDVNVHPRKLEVRFANEQNIFRIFYHSINEKLSNLSLVKTENDILETENLHTIFTQSSHNLQITDNNFSKSQEKYYVPS
jgi:DNA mismatch repair protein mutL